MPTPSALPQVYSFRLTDRTRSALSVTCLARDGKRSFFERVWDHFLVRYSCSSPSSTPRPSLILLVLPFIRALFVRMSVPPGPQAGYLGCILGRLGSLLDRLEAVWGQLEALLGRVGASWALLSLEAILDRIGPS